MDIAENNLHLGPQGPLGALHVLLVEDDEITLRTVKKLLQGCGYEVTSTRNGREALDVLDASDSCVDMVLTDIRMPEISGLDLASQLQHQKYSHIPVIVMSSLDGQESVLEAMEAGAQDYLIKPVRRNELATLWRHVWKSNPKKRTAPQTNPSNNQNNNSSKPTSSSDNTANVDDFGRLHALAVHSLRLQEAEDDDGGGKEGSPPHNNSNSDDATQQGTTTTTNAAGNTPPNGQTTTAAGNSAPPHLLHLQPPRPGQLGIPPGGIPQPLDIRAFPPHLPPPPIFVGPPPPGGRPLFPAPPLPHQASSSDTTGLAVSSSFSNMSMPQRQGSVGAPYHHYYTALVPPPLPRQAAAAAQHQQQQQLFLKAFHAAVQHHQTGNNPQRTMSTSGTTTTALPRNKTGSGMDPEAEAWRKAAVERFRQKRKERSFQKKVRYQSRKRLADSRPRVKGQFVKQVPAAAAAAEKDGSENNNAAVAAEELVNEKKEDRMEVEN